MVKKDAISNPSAVIDFYNLKKGKNLKALSCA